MLLKYALCISAVVLAASAASVRAGYMTDSATYVVFSGDTDINCPLGQEKTNSWHDLCWSITDGVGQLSLQDHAQVTTPDVHTYTQSMTNDPSAVLSLLLYNNSGADWIAYDVSISTPTPGATVAFTSTPAPSSPIWQNTPTVTGGTNIHYSGADPLLNGGGATLSYGFTITPPTDFSGALTFVITSTPTLAPIQA